MLKQINSRQQHSEVTDLVSTGVEEVPQTDDVAVVQLPHDLQLTVLENKRKTVRDHDCCCFFWLMISRIMYLHIILKLY